MIYPVDNAFHLFNIWVQVCDGNRYVHIISHFKFDHVYMIGRVTRHMLSHLSGVPQLHVNRPLARAESEALVDIYSFLKQRKKIMKRCSATAR